ncbi:MAG: hypothetical protein ACK44H_10625 [Candidatus Kryptonium sp.]
MNEDGYKVTTILSYEKVSGVWVCKVKIIQSKKTGSGNWDEREIEAVEIARTFNSVEESLVMAMVSVTEYLSAVNGDLFKQMEDYDETLDS